MARTLERLQQQYNRAASAKRQPGGPGGPHGPGPRGSHGKPKNARATIARLLGYVSRYKIQLALVLVCMILHTVTNLCGSYMLAPIIDNITLAVNPEAEIRMSAMETYADSLIRAVAQTPFIASLLGSTAARVTFYVLAGVIVLGSVYLVSLLTTYLQARLMMTVSQNAIESIRNDLFTKMQRLPVRFFDSNSTGEVMSRYTNDIDNIDSMLSNSLTSIFSGVITLLGTFVFMVTTNWILTLVTIVFIPIFAKGGALISGISRKYYSSQQAALGAVNGYIEETVTGQKVVKVFNHEQDCVEEFGLLNDDMRDKQFKAQFFGGIMGPVMGNTSQISYAITVGLGGVMMCTSGFTPGALTVFANYSRQFSMPINQIASQMSAIFSALAGAERVFAVMDMQPEQSDKPQAVAPERLEGNVVLDHVTFGYNPDKVILKDISLYAKPGQKIAFVGSTGAGKTTVTNLLNRFYDVDQGTITIDGVNVRDYKREYLRQNIAMVLQDTHLFTGTVMENIRYGRLDATDEEVIETAKMVSAHAFITRLADGYNTLIEGDGANLSQGQRQLLNIARAALSKAPILVLDEATSSVDTRTERLIEQGMDHLMKDRTTFVIAHRLSTVRNANAIMVLENGVIIERGDHDSLLALKGRYYELYTGKKELD